MLEKYFRLHAAGSTVPREILAGLTTFLAMSAILAINPQILSAAHGAGMDYGAVFVATCLSAAFGCLIMGLLANYPIGQGPGLGIDAFFSFGLVAAVGSWQLGLGVVFWSGVLFLLVSLFRLRSWLIEGLPDSLKQAISAGVGLFIALIALQNARITVANPDTLLALGPLAAHESLLAMLGFLLIVILSHFRLRGAIILGVLGVTALSLALGFVEYQGAFSPPPSLAPTFLQMDWRGALHPQHWNHVLAFFLLSLMETSGTLIAIGYRGGFIDAAGRFPRLGRALVADSSAISLGALLGTSSTTSYLESSTGIAAGGRTGLTAITIALCFLLALFLAPLAAMVPPYATAPAMFYVAILMLQSLTRLDWDDLGASAPAVVCMTTMAFTFSITDGIALGMLSYTLIRLGTGHWRKVSLPVALMTLLFIARYVWLV